MNAASFALIAVVLATCRHLPAAHTEREPFAVRIREGLRYARTDRVARLLLSGEALAIVFFTLIVPIEIVYAEETLKTDEADTESCSRRGARGSFSAASSSWPSGGALRRP